LRDIQRTGQQPQEALQQVTETVFPMYKAYIEPDLKYAEIRILNTFNPLSGLLNPVYTLKAEVDRNTIQQLIESFKIKLPEMPTKPTTEKYYDIYLHPPDAKDTLICKDWIRVRINAGLYSILFSEDLKEGNFIISPRVDFTINRNILGGLMAVGYQIGAIIHRQSTIYRESKERLSISLDSLEELGTTYIQIKGNDRLKVQAASDKLGLTKFEPYSYIELYQQKFKKAKL